MKAFAKRVSFGAPFAKFAIHAGCRLAILAGLIIATPAVHAAGATTCNLEALRRYPMTDAIKLRAIALKWPAVTFPAPGKPIAYNFKAAGTEDIPVWKDALARGLKTFRPEERSVLMLATIDSWTSTPDGLRNFFVLDQGIYLDEVLATLDREGLKDHAALFRQGRALFGMDYGSPQSRYDRWSDGHGAILDPALDASLVNLSARYRALPSLLDVAEARIAASPKLTTIFEPLRERATDDQRLAYLTSGLLKCFDGHGPPDQELAEIAALPPAYARIITVYLFEAEMLNGSVEQFFFNSTGNFAPEVVAALSAMDLKKHADAVQRAIDLFPKPYPRGVFTRRSFMRRGGDGFSRTLEELTGAVDDGAMHLAMIRVAKAADILPK